MRDVSGEMLRGGTTVAGEDGWCGSHYSIALSSLYRPHIHIAHSRAAGAEKSSQATSRPSSTLTTARKFIAKGTRNSDSGDLARTGDNATKLNRRWRKRSCKNYLMTVTHDGEGRIEDHMVLGTTTTCSEASRCLLHLCPQYLILVVLCKS